MTSIYIKNGLLYLNNRVLNVNDFRVALTNDLLSIFIFDVSNNVILPGTAAATIFKDEAGTVLYADTNELMSVISEYLKNNVFLPELTSTGKFMKTIDIFHEKIHDGKIFKSSHFFENVANNDTVRYLMRTGAKEVHIIIASFVEGEGEYYLLENPTITGDGTPLDVINKKRSSANTALTTVFHSTIISAPGTVLQSTRGGIGSTVAKETRDLLEWILAPNTDYLISIKNVAGMNKTVAFETQFYEV